jgi:heat-inducible transcriptional repressor
MLDERKANVLKAVVSEYIETAEPVGSARVAAAPGVEVSPATVRNDMAVLEQEGYLAQPHTSAGRVPTDKGYRFFVDALDGAGRLGASENQQVRQFFNQAHRELESMLHDTSQLLSNLTSYTAVVVGPPHEVATIRSVQLVSLTPRLALLVLVLSNGAIEKHTVELADDTDELAINACSVRLGELLTGHTVAGAADVPVAGSHRSPLLDQALDALRHTDPNADEQVFTTGTARMASAFDAVATVGEVLRILEQQFVVVTLLKDVLDRGLSVAIGTETGIEPLNDCAVVVAPYLVDGEAMGTVGVLGPTRMNYPQALSAVAAVSQRLGKRLSEG